jgi:hypothetical protein
MGIEANTLRSSLIFNFKVEKVPLYDNILNFITNFAE